MKDMTVQFFLSMEPHESDMLAKFEYLNYDLFRTNINERWSYLIYCGKNHILTAYVVNKVHFKMCFHQSETMF